MSLNNLLWVLVVVLVIAWALGLGGVYRLGGSPHLIHLLLVIVVIAVIFNLLPRR